jgi:hypothetical protein
MTTHTDSQVNPSGLSATVLYRFAARDVLAFAGRPCHFLSNSWHDALDQIRAECRRRGEPFSARRTAMA